MTSFFNDTRTNDLPTLDDYRMENKACCQTKKLAYELFKMAADTKGFPYNDPELMNRSISQNLNAHMMRPYYELAIKIMRKFGKLKMDEGDENNNDKQEIKKQAV